MKILPIFSNFFKKTENRNKILKKVKTPKHIGIDGYSENSFKCIKT